MHLKTALLVLLIVGPLITFLLVFTRDVRLVPLVGVDYKCALCDRKATRTLEKVAKSLRTKGLYFYEKRRYSGVPPAWCDIHRPDDTAENILCAYLSALGTFGLLALLYEKLPDKAE